LPPEDKKRMNHTLVIIFHFNCFFTSSQRRVSSYRSCNLASFSGIIKGNKKNGGVMTIGEMLGQSGSLALLGMGVMFTFLIILIISVIVMGKVIRALGLDKDVQKGASAPAAVKAAGGGEVTAAIGAAVNEYRKNNS
jgi:oxaloacetate decarboxylase gamma subunit